MRIRNCETLQTNSSKSVLAIRHGEDESILDGSYNRPLIPETIPVIQTLGNDIADMLYQSAEVPGVRIYHSSKLRTSQTAAILEQCLTERSIQAERVHSELINELCQGELNLDRPYIGDEQYEPLHKAWKAFQEAIRTGDLYYRFGDPVRNGSGCKYPELVTHFRGFGENQIEFSKRIYEFLLRLVDCAGDHLPLIITHQAVVSRFQRITDVCSKIDCSDSLAPGQLVRELEKTGQRLPVEHAEGVMIKLTNASVLREVLLRELDYLNSL